MGIRDRIKGRIKQVVGKGDAPERTSPAGAMPTTAATPLGSPPGPAAVSAPATKATPAPKAAAASTPAARKPPTRPAKVEDAGGGDTDKEAEAVKAAKIAKHKLKTKVGMLKWLGEQEGGQASLGDMHDRSEKRFFVAHRGFSNLMEEYTGQGLVEYDQEAGIATITDAGRKWKP